MTAGTVNCDGSLVVRATAAGDATVLADIVRLVETAQARAAPVQRLADAVAGRFAYGVLGASAATFCFWTLFGQQLFPQVMSRITFHDTGQALPPTARLMPTSRLLRS